MSDQIPEPLEKSGKEQKQEQVDALWSEIKKWIAAEVPFRGQLQSSIVYRNECQDSASMVIAEELVAAASLPVMGCQRNIERLKTEMLDIASGDFSLFKKYIYPPIPTTSNHPLQ
jgi:hypothetical protein